MVDFKIEMFLWKIGFPTYADGIKSITSVEVVTISRRRDTVPSCRWKLAQAQLTKAPTTRGDAAWVPDLYQEGQYVRDNKPLHSYLLATLNR
jgi:hypothetical protein